MNSAEVRLMQFKPTIKDIWKVWVHELLFFEVLKVSQKYIELVAQKKQFKGILEILWKFRPFLLKKEAFSRKVDAVVLMYNVNFWGYWPKKFGAKVVGKGFFSYWGYD